MDSWKSRSRLHVWRSRKVILNCRKTFNIKAVQIFCSPVLFFSTVTGLSGLWTCCAAIQNELCFRLSLAWVQLCHNWGISGLEKVHFLLHITKIKLASPNGLPRPCGSRSGIWGTWCRNWNPSGIWCTNHEGNLPAVSWSPVVITSSGSSRSNLLHLDSMLYLLTVLASRSILGDVCVYAGSALYLTLQGQCTDSLTLQELSQIQDT